MAEIDDLRAAVQRIETDASNAVAALRADIVKLGELAAQGALEPAAVAELVARLNASSEALEAALPQPVTPPAPPAPPAPPSA